jgi:16S rRNA (adenine1518-N6/adenine1519-N6)-dimethyltransferase
LGGAEIRALAQRWGVAPSKGRGQNFVVDANTVRRIATVAGVTAADRVLEVGPGLGSLTLALLETGASVLAVEIDPVLAEALPVTVGEWRRSAVLGELDVVLADGLAVGPADLPGRAPTVLVANLPYNVAVPILLGLLERMPSLTRGVVMVQAEVGRRLAAEPGSKVYGVPSVKAAWWADVSLAGSISRSVFWPVPNVDSLLVRFVRRATPGDEAMRLATFELVNAAFGQRRKTLRSALAGVFGSAAAAEAALRAASLDPTARGETLSVADYARLAQSA